MLWAEVLPFLSRSFVGQGLWTRMYQSFGYLTRAGYGGHVFPVVFGETGSFLTAVSCLLSDFNLVYILTVQLANSKICCTGSD